MSRTVSHSEAVKLLTCQRAHAFAYTGTLTDGTALKPKVAAEILREGSAWGVALATWHDTGSVREARRALGRSLHADAKVMRAHGVFVKSYAHERARRMMAILDHHVATSARFPAFHSPELRLLVPIPKMRGVKLIGYLDGLSDEEDGTWIVENKFRGDLSSLAQVELGRQFRWYAWGYREQHGRDPVGIIVDERVNGLPGPVVLNKDGTPRKGQAGCSADDYLSACLAAGAEPDVPTVAKLHAKRWHVQHRIMFRTGELDEVEDELRSVATQLRRADVRETYPVPNPSAGLCRNCDFRDICADPEPDLIDLLFHRVPPKAARPDRR